VPDEKVVNCGKVYVKIRVATYNNFGNYILDAQGLFFKQSQIPATDSSNEPWILVYVNVIAFPRNLAFQLKSEEDL